MSPDSRFVLFGRRFSYRATLIAVSVCLTWLLGAAPPSTDPPAKDNDLKTVVESAAPTEEELLRQDLKRLTGRWERTVPGSNPPMREVLTIEGERDTFDVINTDGAVVCRYTGQFKLERAGDVRIYNRSDVKLEKGKPLNNSGSETQSFIFKFTRGGFYEVAGALHGRSSSRQRQGVFLWKEFGAKEKVEGDDKEVEKADHPDDQERPAIQPAARAANDPELKRDLELMQGSWLIDGRNAEGQVIWTNQKLVEGNTERVTYFDADGKVTSEHTVKFRLEKHGPVRVFNFYDMTTVVGPNVGAVTPDDFAFVYKVVNDKFLDCPGAFVSRSSYRTEPAMTVWRRPQPAQEVDAELEIEKLGGSVTRTTRDEGDTTYVRLNGMKFGDEHLRLLNAFEKLSELTLVDSRVTDAGMNEIAQCVNLTRLDVRGTVVTDAGLKEIAKLKKLKILGLVRTRITDAGLAELSGLKDLRQIYLANTNITDTGAHELVKLKELNYLGVIGTKITEVGFEELSQLSNLKTLFVGGASVTEASVEQFVKFKNLAVLSLGNSRITEAGLQKIKAALPETNVHR